MTLLLGLAFIFTPVKNNPLKKHLMTQGLLRNSRNGDETRVLQALAVGCDMNAADAEGRTPLILALDFNHPLLVGLLVQQGADVNRADTLGRTALMIAVENSEPTVIELLLAHGARVNTSDIGGRTALMKAASRNRESALMVLLKHSADVSQRSTRGETALQIAEKAGHGNIAALLKAAGAQH